MDLNDDGVGSLQPYLSINLQAGRKYYIIATQHILQSIPSYANFYIN